jgi:hypothetical protein
MGKAKTKTKLKGILSKTREVNVLSAARFFLFGARDVWFVVGVPVFYRRSCNGASPSRPFLAVGDRLWGPMSHLASFASSGHAPQDARSCSRSP